MDTIKNLFYKYLYKSNGNKVMGALTNSYAYEIYKQTNEAKISNKEANDRRIKNKLKDLERDIDCNITSDMSDGKYKSKTECYYIRLTREQKKYLRDLYESQGFKIRFGYKKRRDYFKIINTITISWKHYKAI